MSNTKFWHFVRQTRGNVTQQACADALGITRIKYINYEKGKYDKPSDDFLTKLGELLNLTLEELQDKWDEFEGEEIEPQNSLDHLSAPIRELITNPKYKDIIEKAILKYLADEALSKK